MSLVSITAAPSALATPQPTYASPLDSPDYDKDYTGDTSGKALRPILAVCFFGGILLAGLTLAACLVRSRRRANKRLDPMTGDVLV
ncbi:hypothetical protein HDU88_006369, partial [Geranomyces variabilis]